MMGCVTTAQPSIVDVRAALGEVKAALLGLGATAPGARSVAFELDEHVLLVAYEEEEKQTVIAIGGERSAEVAHWLARQLERHDWVVRGILTP